MPHRRKAFTLVELLVVTGIIGLLVAILLPALSKARNAGNLVACASNLRQLHMLMLMYEQDNKGKLIVEWTAGPMWPYLLKPYYSKLPGANVSVGNTQMRDKILSCPLATDKPSDDSDNSPTPSPYQQYFTNHSSFGRVQASYGMNRWLYDTINPIPKGAGYSDNARYWYVFYTQKGQGGTNFWKLQRLSSGSNQIPLFFDCRWREARPSSNTEGYYPMGSGDMTNVATKRHGRFVNVSFVDGSTKTLPLQELWALKWHTSWTRPSTLPKVPW